MEQLKSLDIVAPKIISNVKNKKAKYQCFCGNTFEAFVSNVNRKHTRSCGCICKRKRPFKTRKRVPTNVYLKEEGIYYLIITKKNREKVKSKIDKSSIEKLVKYNWVTNAYGYINTSKNRKNISLHRYLLDAPKEMQVDHINRDRLDNRLKNLRLCTRTENQRNRMCKGYSFDTSRNKWIVSIKLAYKTKHIGRFDTEKEALNAREKAEKKYFENFAVKRT